MVTSLYAPVLIGLVGDWYRDQNYSHGFLVPVLSAYLIWQKRKQLATISPRPSFWGILIVLASLGSLFLGSLGAEFFLTRIALLGTIAGLVVYFSGWATLRILVFPLGFLVLMIPLPALLYNEIIFPLQLLASRFATTCLTTINLVPVVREGNILVLPHHEIEVVEACSGIRSLMSLLTLAVGYSYLAEPSLPMRILLVLAMIPLAVVSNGLRVMGTALITQYWGPEAAEGFLHSFYGWAIFLLAATMLFVLHGLIRWLRRTIRSKETI
jgi:exosortase